MLFSLGLCNQTSNTTFECICQPGWTGKYCELMISYCKNIACQNNGVCRTSLLNYTCLCLDDNYSGQYCENVSTKIKIWRILAKSIAFVAIIFILATVAYIVTMDILKYCFGIDLAKVKVKRKMKRHRPVYQRFIYVTDASH